MTVKASLLSLAATLAAAGAAATGAAADPLAAHRWENRLLVVVAPAEDGRVAEQRRLFADARTGNRERDLVWIEAIGSGREAVAVRRRFEVPAGEFRAILVGKDGGAKLVSDAPIASARLFDTIDAMPMRQDEARRRAP